MRIVESALHRRLARRLRDAAKTVLAEKADVRGQRVIRRSGRCGGGGCRGRWRGLRPRVAKHQGGNGDDDGRTSAWVYGHGDSSTDVKRQRDKRFCRVPSAFRVPPQQLFYLQGVAF